jgi:G3E family GTPase
MPTISAEKISQLDAWLRSILWDRHLPSSNSLQAPGDFEVHRLKGLFHLANGRIKIIQGVREIFEITDSETHWTAPTDVSKIVLIGQGLGTNSSPWKESLNACLESTEIR